ncbi:MAG: hypothetical protein ACOYO1_10460 [Bacteroidales bacterium]
MKITLINLRNYLKLNVKTGIFISFIFFIYLIYRAILVPFLHDEIMSYWFYINSGNYLPFSIKLDQNAANNHLLNSALSRFFYLLFGYTPFVLRLANLIFIPIYCFFAYKLADLLKNKYLAILCWLCLLLIHSIVEFMALSRGYGMSFALLLGSIWFLLKSIREGKTIDYFFTMFILISSVTANLSLLTTSLIIIALLIINIIFKQEKAVYKLFKIGILLITGILPIVFLTVYSFALQKAGALYYGNHDGFWLQSVTSLMNALFDNQSHQLRFAILAYFFIIIILSLKYIFSNFKFTIFQRTIIVFPALLIGNIIAVLLMAKIFNVNFPEDRSGFYFYYFFIGSLFFLIDNFTENIKYKKVVWILIPFSLIPLHFIYASNLTHIAVYKEDRVPYRFYEKLKTKSELMPEVATVGSYFGRTLVLAYQNYLKNGNLAKSHDTDYPSLIPDFLVVKTDEFAIWRLYYDSIDFDKVSGYHLLERKNKLYRHKILEFPSISTKGKINDEFFNLAEGRIDTLIQKPLFFEYTMDIESKSTPFEAWIVLAVSDSIGKTTAYEYIPLNWIKNEWSASSKHFHNGQLLTNLPVTSLKYVTYIWNMNKQFFSITNAKIIIKELDE